MGRGWAGYGAVVNSDAAGTLTPDGGATVGPAISRGKAVLLCPLLPGGRCNHAIPITLWLALRSQQGK